MSRRAVFADKRRNRFIMWRPLVVVVSWFLASIAADIAIAAQDQTLPSAGLTKVDVSIYPWSSIAKLNNSVGGSCTAAVIEQDKVLTAAHCLFNRRTSRFLPASALHLLFGYEQGRFFLHALVGSYTRGSADDVQPNIATLSSDWAVLTLTAPLPDGIRPLQLVDHLPAAGSGLMMGGYARRRLYFMTADTNCRLLGEVPGSLLLTHNCQAAQGSSGAPLLLMEGDVAVIVGVQVAIGHHSGTDVMLAVSAPSIAEGQLH
jgi:protease YdgD